MSSRDEFDRLLREGVEKFKRRKMDSFDTDVLSRVGWKYTAAGNLDMSLPEFIAGLSESFWDQEPSVQEAFVTEICVLLRKRPDEIRLADKIERSYNEIAPAADREPDVETPGAGRTGAPAGGIPAGMWQSYESLIGQPRRNYLIVPCTQIKLVDGVNTECAPMVRALAWSAQLLGRNQLMHTTSVIAEHLSKVGDAVGAALAARRDRQEDYDWTECAWMVRRLATRTLEVRGQGPDKNGLDELRGFLREWVTGMESETKEMMLGLTSLHGLRLGAGVSPREVSAQAKDGYTFTTDFCKNVIGHVFALEQVLHKSSMDVANVVTAMGEAEDTERKIERMDVFWPVDTRFAESVIQRAEPQQPGGQTQT